jgi:hypothetical protein
MTLLVSNAFLHLAVGVVALPQTGSTTIPILALLGQTPRTITLTVAERG